MINKNKKIFTFLIFMVLSFVIYFLIKKANFSTPFVLLYNILIVFFGIYFRLYHKTINKFDYFRFSFLFLCFLVANLLQSPQDLYILLGYALLFVTLLISSIIFFNYKIKMNENINVKLYKPIISQIIESDAEIMKIGQEVQILEHNKAQKDLIFTMASNISKKFDIFEVLHTFGDFWVSKLKFDNFVIFFDNIDFQLPEGVDSFSLHLNQDMRNYVHYIRKKITNLAQMKIIASYSMNISEENEFNHFYKPSSELHSFILIPLALGTKYNVEIGFFPGAEDVNQSQFNDGLVATQNFALVLNRLLLYYKVKAMSIQDGLTELYLHRFFMESLDGELERAQRYNTELALIMFDIDHFKKFNDTYGHLVGDDVLSGVGKAIRQTVDKDMIPARYGGEEFIIICPRPKQIIEFAKKLKKNIEEVVIIDENSGKQLSIKVSMGIVFRSEEDNKPQSIIKKVDDALYYAKNHGRDKIVNYPDKIVN